MKKQMKSIVTTLLRIRASKILSSSPEVIAVTGSMGKTTTKTLLEHILSTQFTVIASKGGFNTPIGILLSLLGEEKSGFSSSSEWIKILFRAYTSPVPKAQKIILEYGVDRPGDMDDLLDILTPQTAIITSIAPVHIGKGLFKNIEEIIYEKSKLYTSLPQGGIGILNMEDPELKKISELKTKGTLIKLGKSSEHDIYALDIRTEKNGTSFVYGTKEERFECFIPIFGEYISMIAVPAIYIARENGISKEKITQALKTFNAPSGRGKILKGKNNSTIWDSSYNANPKAVESSLQTLPFLPAKKRIVLLGNMNELGEESNDFHTAIGSLSADVADEIHFIGDSYEAFEKGVKEKKKNCMHHKDAVSAGKFLEKSLQPGDLLLVKGSQGGIFLESAIEKILANPDDKKLLCRRGKQWEKKRDALFLKKG